MAIVAEVSAYAAKAPTRFRLRSPPPDPPEAPIPTTSPLPLLSLLAAVACSSPVALPPRATAIAASGDQPDLLLFQAPGLRADFPGAPGAEAAFTAPLSERLDARFTAAYSASPARWVGLGTLPTGRYPAAVPLLCGLPSTGPRATEGAPWCTTLPAEVPTLPEVLALYGYQTALFAFHLAGQSLITDRFDETHDLDPTWELPTTLCSTVDEFAGTTRKFVDSRSRAAGARANRAREYVGGSGPQRASGAGGGILPPQKKGQRGASAITLGCGHSPALCKEHIHEIHLTAAQGYW